MCFLNRFLTSKPQRKIRQAYKLYKRVHGLPKIEMVVQHGAVTAIRHVSPLGHTLYGTERELLQHIFDTAKQQGGDLTKTWFY